ncbi:MAG: 16S rRNA (adenine(1518)-N(6)/adenine(1519)-N(6))-dimethyltransferase RsmA [bacterium]|nr:16S rRNA (adenine(1518)-N(6)/adenine(1519)-N(6))-dimethyltransferase RsmA [bacterium]
MVAKAFRPKKRFGQNFLYDPAIAGRITDAAGLSQEDVVIELGAGKGILTKPLAQACGRLIALEIDTELHKDLASHFESTNPPLAKVEVLNVDFTEVSLTGLATEAGYDRCVLMGNIPYHLTRDVLFSFLVDESEMIQSAYLMMQREVGERIASSSGSKVYGITSVILQSLYSVRSLFKVRPGSFFPPPKVDSIVLEFKPLDEPLVPVREFKSFKTLVKNVFQQRRKTLHNSIKAFYSVSVSELRQIGELSGIDLQKRPEAVSKEGFLAITRALSAVMTKA